MAIETDLGPLDVVQGLDGVPDYPELRSSAVETETLGVKVAVCSIDALREMKRAAGPPAITSTSKTSMQRAISSTIALQPR